MSKVSIETYGMEGYHGYADEYVKKIVSHHTGTEYCLRCGETHESLDWKPLSNPSFSAPEGALGSAVVAWAMCPVKAEPIFIEAWEDKEGS